MLSVIMLNVVMLSVIMLNVVMLSVITLNVVMLNVVAPSENILSLVCIKVMAVFFSTGDSQRIYYHLYEWACFLNQTILNRKGASLR
jgi:hypothetical protein